MKISEKWHINGRPGDFVLTERLVRKDKTTGAEKVSEKQTYHPTIEQCLNKVVLVESRNHLGGDNEVMAENVTDLKVFLDNLKVDLQRIAAQACASGVTNEG